MIDGDERYKSKVVVLCSSDDYRHESSRMRHCISSYAGSGSKNTYVAMHIRNLAEDLTLGCRVSRSGGFAKLKYEQAYKHSNQYISTGNKKFCMEVVSFVNSELDKIYEEMKSKTDEEKEEMRKDFKHLFSK